MPQNTKKMRITVEGKSYEVLVEVLESSTPTGGGSGYTQPAYSQPASSPAPAAVSRPAPSASAGGPKTAGSVVSPLSGTVITVHVKEGQSVKEGDVVITLEAMKMNTPVRAPVAGTVKSISATPGNAVDEGAVLMEIG